MNILNTKLLVSMIFGLCLTGICVRYVGSTTNVAIPPEQDAFLSYWQCAEGLANGLLQIQSHDEFFEVHEIIGATNPDAGNSMKIILDGLCEELENHKTAFGQLSADEIQRLTQQHADLVQNVKVASVELATRHSTTPEILGEDWLRYSKALCP